MFRSLAAPKFSSKVLLSLFSLLLQSFTLSPTPNGGQNPSLEFQFRCVTCTLHEPILYCCASTIFLIIVSSYIATLVNQRRPLTIHFYGLDENDKDAPKKRRMGDSINLLQEGYRKVIASSPFPSPFSFTKERATTMRSPYRELKLTMLTITIVSLETDRFKYGLRKEIKLFYLQSL